MSWLLSPTPNLIPSPGCSACIELNKVSPKQAFGTVLVFWGLWFICLLGYGPSNAAMSTSAAHHQLLSWQLRNDTSYSHVYLPGGQIDLHLAEIEARFLVRSWCHYWLQIIGATVSLRLRHARSNPQDCAIHLSHVLYANPELDSFKPLVLCIQVLLLHSNDRLWDFRTPCFVLYHITWFTSEHARLWSLDPQFCAIFRTSYPLICATNTQLQRPTANQFRLSFQTPKIVQSLQYLNPSYCANECCGFLSALRTPNVMFRPLKMCNFILYWYSIRPLEMCMWEFLTPPILCIDL